MRSMKELRMIIYAVLGSVRSMMWSLVLLGAVLYMVSLICVQGVVGYMQSPEVGEREDRLYDDMVKYWGSVPISMLTLFMSSTGGLNWNIAYEALSEAGLVFGFG